MTTKTIHPSDCHCHSCSGYPGTKPKQPGERITAVRLIIPKPPSTEPTQISLIFAHDPKAEHVLDVKTAHQIGEMLITAADLAEQHNAEKN